MRRTLKNPTLTAAQEAEYATYERDMIRCRVIEYGVSKLLTGEECGCITEVEVAATMLREAVTLREQATSGREEIRRIAAGPTRTQRRRRHTVRVK